MAVKLTSKDLQRATGRHHFLYWTYWTTHQVFFIKVTVNESNRFVRKWELKNELTFPKLEVWEAKQTRLFLLLASLAGTQWQCDSSPNTDQVANQQLALWDLLALCYLFQTAAPQSHNQPWLHVCPFVRYQTAVDWKPRLHLGTQPVFVSHSRV